MHTSLRIYLFSHACTYIYVYIYICINICAGNSRHGEIHACMQTYIRAWIYACTQIYATYTHTRILFFKDKDIQTYVCIRMYMYVNVHVYRSTYMYTGIYRCRHRRVDRLCDYIYIYIFIYVRKSIYA